MFSLIRRTPYSELPSFEREADRLFRNFFNWPRFPFGEDGGEATLIEPSVNVFEEADNVVVEAQVPGLKKEELQLHLTGDRLTLRGETKHESEKKDRNYHTKEMRYGAFERTIPLPYEVAADKVKAELKDGVLRVTLPKSETARQRTRQIEVKAA
ncbi:MAG TPA: Hsp20/alpha crystallin family protein [Bryobacterales bacterium]|nr:Hsp20/alpha crystallin family protein [Bryobacterales bacterium]